jgi:amino acid adenylation domain-containing protein
MSTWLDRPASHAQRAIWTLQRIEPDLDVFCGGYAASADARLDPACLDAALCGLVARHEAMRTTFHDAGGRFVQRVHQHMEIGGEWRDAAGDTDAALVDRMLADLRRPYDLEQGPLLRVSVYVRSGGEHVVLVGAHHITCDLLSARLLMEELEERYVALRDGLPDRIPPLPLQFRQHAEWQNTMLDGAQGRRHEAYWRDRLGGEAPDLAMPIDHARPPVEVHRGCSHLFDLPAGLVTRLEAVAKASDATLYSVLLAGYAVLLHRFSGSSIVTVGSYTSGRVRRSLDPLVGLVSNPIPLRVATAGAVPFAELVRDVARAVRGAFRHQFYPLTLMAERIERPRDPGRSPLFQAALNLNRDEPLRLDTPEWRHDAWLPLLLRNQEGQLELKLMACVRRDGTLAAALQYQTALYDPATAERLARAWIALLEDAVENPTREISALRLMDAGEEHRIVHEWNQTARDYAREAGVHQLVRAQCRRTPEARAVSHGPDTITYDTLARRVTALAGRLGRMGAGPESVVGLCLPPSIEQVVTLLAVLETGAAYLPLDPAHPADRRQAMVDDAGAAIVVGTARTLEGLAAARPFLLDRFVDLSGTGSDPSTSSDAAGGGDRIAYVLFTSGSTGRPKGVAIAHRSVVNLLAAMQDLLAITPADTWLSITTLSFDIAALEIFLPLVHGAHLVMADRDVAGSGARLSDEIERSHATVVQATPTSWRLLQASSRRPSRPLTRLCGGEQLTRALADQLLRDPGPLWNVYGPTETTIWSTASRVGPGHRTPAIGRPLANTQVYILDSHMQPVPIGVVGELWIGGDGVAHGYRGQPALTAERFVPDPFRPGHDARLYRTGDLARWLASGELEYHGRDDQQVKVRGIRIELGEIEVALLDQPEVAEAVVTARSGFSGEVQLAAYVVPAAGRHPSPTLLRQRLRARLPDYMVPASFTLLAAMPLTPNRKVDRRALPAPGPETRPEASFTAPRTPLEHMLARLVADVLDLERAGIDDDFFELGGASLASLELAARAEQAGLTLGAESVFEHRTVRALAAALGAQADGEAADEDGCAVGGTS